MRWQYRDDLGDSWFRSVLFAELSTPPALVLVVIGLVTGSSDALWMALVLLVLGVGTYPLVARPPDWRRRYPVRARFYGFWARVFGNLLDRVLGREPRSLDRPGRYRVAEHVLRYWERRLLPHLTKPGTPPATDDEILAGLLQDVVAGIDASGGLVRVAAAEDIDRGLAQLDPSPTVTDVAREMVRTIRRVSR